MSSTPLPLAASPRPRAHAGFDQLLLGWIKGLVVEVDRDGRYLEVLSSDPAMHLVPRETLLAHTVTELFDDALGRWFLDVVRRVCDTGVRERANYTLQIDGCTRRFSADMLLAPWCEPGKPTVVMLSRDVTDDNLAEEARQRADHERNAFIDAAPFPVLIHDEGVIRRANQAAARCFAMLGPESLVGRGLAELVHPDDARAACHHGLLRGGGAEIYGTVRGLRSDGRSVLLHCMTMPLFYENRAATAILCKDVTEEQRMEDERRALAVLVEAAYDAITACDLQGHITSWSLGAQRLYGHSAAEAVGQHISIVFAPGTASDALLVNRVQRGEHVYDHETTRRRRDGRIIEVSVTLSPIHAPDGAVTGVAAVTRDITEHKRMQESLAQAHRMASLGTLAAGLAHEVNNPLAFVTANLDFVQDALAGDGPIAVEELADIRAALGDARLGADRIRAIVRDFKAFSRSEETETQAVDLAATLERATQMARNEIKHRARLWLEIGALPRVAAAESQLGQVFVNLLVNAAQAIPEDGARSGLIRVVASTDESGAACVEIADNGSGIAPEVLPRIFDPFFTTKDVGVGTGLGLSIVHGIISRLGGRIEVESVVGQGTTFRVVLPAAARDTARPPTPLTKPHRVRRARILVVDDEPMVTRAVQRMLGREHDVVSTTQAHEALARLRAGEQYDVIFSDLMMPEMSGMELFAALTAIRPEQAERVVFLTGGAFTPAAQAFLQGVSNPRVDKPFDRRMLADMIADMMPASVAPVRAVAAR